MAILEKNIIYTAVAYGSTVLVGYNQTSTNPSTIVGLVLNRIQPEDNEKLSFIYDDYLIHYSTTGGTPALPNGLTYIVMARKVLGKRIPFTLLSDVEKSFNELYDATQITKAKENGLKDFGSTLKSLVEVAETGESDPAFLARGDIDEVRDIMVQNIERILERGERINLLVNKTDIMNTNAAAFRRRTVQIKRHLWWKNVKMMAFLTIGGIILLYLIIGSACGLPFYDRCFRSGN